MIPGAVHRIESTRNREAYVKLDLVEGVMLDGSNVSVYLHSGVWFNVFFDSEHEARAAYQKLVKAWTEYHRLPF